jgi:hypothetical protein
MKKLLVAAVIALVASALSYPAHADGTPSTGSFTVVSSPDLSAAYATGQITISSVAGSVGAKVTVGSVALREGVHWRVGVSSYATASSLASAINQYVGQVTAAVLLHGHVIQLTASDIGALYNSVSLRTSTPTAVGVSGATLTGGLDNASVAINHVKLVQGRDWFVGASETDTALSLATAINRNPGTRDIVEALPNGALVLLQATLSPNHYALEYSGKAGAITKSGTAMTGGTAGNLARYSCDLGNVATLPLQDFPAGCKAYQTSDNKLYISTEQVVGIDSWKALW